MRSISILITFLLFSTLQAQILNINKVKFGKISEEELTMTTYAPNEQAEAVILYDKATLNFEFESNTNNFRYVMQRHLRIKILRTSGTEYANFTFPLESSLVSSYKEEILGVRGSTYNWVNGEKEETKLPKDGTFEEEITDSYKLYKIAFPQVKEGSVIELKYIVKSDFIYNLPTWYFQKEIPVDYSDFEVVIPEYFTYNIDMKGFASSSLTKNIIGKNGTGSFIYKERGEGGRNMVTGNSHQRTTTNTRIEYRTLNSHWIAVEVPSLKDESYSPPAKNYFFKVGFELASTQYPGGFQSTYSTTWESISRQYLASNNLNNYLKPRKAVADLAASWVAGIDSPQEKVFKIYDELKNNFVAEGWYSKYPRKTPSNLLKTKTGYSADINYMLLSLLRAEGISAVPVLVSTRNNGLISIGAPTLSQFNHVIIKVVLDPQHYLLLDATENYVPGSIMPKHNINGRGRVIYKNSSDWIDLSAPAKDKMAMQFELTLDKDGQLNGTAKIKVEDYAALDFREDMHEATGSKSIIEESDVKTYFENWSAATFDEVEITNFENLYEDVIISAQVDFSNQVIDGGEMLYIPSVLMKQYNENPFKAETRDLPIDFIVPQSYVYSTLITLPEGMALEEIPEPVNFALPDNKAKYSIRYIELNGRIQIVEKLTISETFYSNLDYGALRTFFDLVLEKQEIPLVVK